MPAVEIENTDKTRNAMAARDIFFIKISFETIKQCRRRVTGVGDVAP
jgi:hypothetical protein